MNILISLSLTGVISLFGGIFKYRKFVLSLSLIGLLAAVILCGVSWNKNESFFNHMMLTDNYALAFNIVMIIAGAFIILFYNRFHEAADEHLPEVFALIVFTLAGAAVMVSYSNLLMLFLGVEILSLASYILTGLNKKDLSSNEAAMKYFLMGSFSTGFMLFGMALVYGASASFDLSVIANYVSVNQSALPGIFYVGVILILAGLLFKVAAVPFHFWTPDVYHGAPTIVTAFMASVGKIAAFAALYRLFSVSFANVQFAWGSVLWIVAIATMTLGNITAIYQTSMKRMLAYSSIAHIGYMLLAVLSINSYSASAILFYSIGYGISAVTAFVLVFIVQQQYGDDSVDNFKGIAKGNPLVGLVLVVAMLSLSGIPPTAGFFGKFYVFSAAVNAGYVWLVAIAVINSFISAYYYFRPMINGIIQTSDRKPLEIKPFYLFLLLLLTAVTIILGVLPGLVSGII